MDYLRSPVIHQQRVFRRVSKIGTGYDNCDFRDILSYLKSFNGDHYGDVKLFILKGGLTGFNGDLNGNIMEDMIMGFVYTVPAGKLTYRKSPF